MMSFEQSKDNFINYLKIEKDASPYTIKFYEIDVNNFLLFLQSESIKEFKDVNHVVVRVFLTQLYDKDLSRRSVARVDRKSTRLNSSHVAISYAVFCLKKKTHLSVHNYMSWTL